MGAALNSLSTMPVAWRNYGNGVHLFTVACNLAQDLPLFPGLKIALRYWNRMRGRHAMPGRQDIDPLDMVDFLSGITLADVETDPLRFRYRLSGTGICQVHQGDQTHLAVDELRPRAYGAMIHGQYAEALKSRRPALHLNLFDNQERFRSYAHLILPLARDHATVDMIMTVDGLIQDSAEMMGLLVRLQHRAGIETGQYYLGPMEPGLENRLTDTRRHFL